VGIIWLVTDNGLKALDVATSKITCYQYQSRDDSRIGGTCVKSTLESRDGTFWVANALSLDEFNLSRGKWQAQALSVPVPCRLCHSASQFSHGPARMWSSVNNYHRYRPIDRMTKSTASFSSRDYATGPLCASTLSNCDRSIVSRSEEVIHLERG